MSSELGELKPGNWTGAVVLFLIISVSISLKTSRSVIGIENSIFPVLLVDRIFS